MKPRARRPKPFKLKGPSEQAIQAGILSVLGTPTWEWRPYKSGARKGELHKVNMNRYVGEGSLFWRSNSGGLKDITGRPVFYGAPGLQDIDGVVYGRAVGFEVKDEDGKQSADQVAWQRDWEKAGGLYYLVRGPNEAFKILQRLRVEGRTGWPQENLTK